jgi:hypothetical protein
VHGLVLANGGVLSYHHAVILSTQPRADSTYPPWNPLPSRVDEEHPVIEESANGGGVIEVCLPAYNPAIQVPHERGGNHLDHSRIHISPYTNLTCITQTYTVQFGRDGSPVLGFVIGRLDSGHRFVANVEDPYTLQQLSGETEQVGKRGSVADEGGRNLFVFEQAKI